MGQRLTSVPTQPAEPKLTDKERARQAVREPPTILSKCKITLSCTILQHHRAMLAKEATPAEEHTFAEKVVKDYSKHLRYWALWQQPSRKQIFALCEPSGWTYSLTPGEWTGQNVNRILLPDPSLGSTLCYAIAETNTNLCDLFTNRQRAQDFAETYRKNAVQELLEENALWLLIHTSCRATASLLNRDLATYIASMQLQLILQQERTKPIVVMFVKETDWRCMTATQANWHKDLQTILA